MFGGISEIQSFNVLFNELWQMYTPNPDLTNQDTEHLNHCRKFPYAPVQSIPIPIPIRGNHCCDFYHHILVLFVLELHKNEAIQYVFFYILFLSLNRMLLRLSMLLYISAIHSFFIAGLHSIVWLQHNLFINSHYVWYLCYFLLLSLWIKLPWTFTHKYSYGHVFLFILSKYLGAKMLDYRVGV